MVLRLPAVVAAAFDRVRSRGRLESRPLPGV